MPKYFYINAIIAVACNNVDDTVKFAFNTFVRWIASCSAQRKKNGNRTNQRKNKQTQNKTQIVLFDSNSNNNNSKSCVLILLPFVAGRLSIALFFCCYHRCRRRCCCSVAAAVQQKGQMVFKQIKQIANYSCYLSLIIGSFFILSLHISLLQRYALHFRSIPSICSLFISCLFHVCFVLFCSVYCLWLCFSHSAQGTARALLAIYLKSTEITAPFLLRQFFSSVIAVKWCANEATIFFLSCSEWLSMAKPFVS